MSTLLRRSNFVKMQEIRRRLAKIEVEANALDPRSTPREYDLLAKLGAEKSHLLEQLKILLNRTNK